MKLPFSQYKTLLINYLRPLKHRVLLLTILLLSSIGLQLWMPQLLRDFIDLAQLGTSTEVLLPLAITFLLATLLAQMVKLGAAYVTQDVKWRATNHMRGDLTAHCLHLDMSFHNNHTPGKMIERIDGDVNELSNFFSQFIIQILGNGLLLLGVLVLLFREDWRIGLGFAIFTAISAVIMSRTVSVAVPHWKARRQTLSDMFGYLEERLSGTEDIRSNGAVAYTMRGLHKIVADLYVKTRRAFVFGEVSWGMSEALFATGTALSLGFGGYLLLQGQITIGTVYLIFHYNTMLRRPIDELTRQLKDLQSATAGIERIQELFDTLPDVQDTPSAEAKPLPYGALNVQFQDVVFGYQADDPVLKGISFAIKPGEVLGLLGRTGSGKTTSTRLLFRLYDPQAGQITLSNVPLTQSNLSDLRQKVGIVTQEVQLFQATVRDNLTFFDDSVPDVLILDTLYRLGLGQWYEDLPQGLDTLLAARNGGLSAGEAQLLAFTRVFLKDPGLVILDEASSRLDPATEQLIENAIDHLFEDRTAIIIAHRLATVQRADKIMILEDGYIREFGDRLALMANPDSRFSQLLRTGMEQVLV